MSLQDDDDNDDDEDDERVQIRQESARKMNIDTSSATYRTLKEHISKLNQQDGTEQIEFKELFSRLRTLPATARSTRMEVEAILFELERENKIMFQDQNIYIL
jgi:predicted transcriptional regulator